MLIVESVVPGSPADGWLEPGDVLVRVNRQASVFIVKFVTYQSCSTVEQNTSPFTCDTMTWVRMGVPVPLHRKLHNTCHSRLHIWLSGRQLLTLCFIHSYGHAGGHALLASGGGPR